MTTNGKEELTDKDIKTKYSNIKSALKLTSSKFEF